MKTNKTKLIPLEIRRARWATYALLFTNGFVQAAWIVHAPHIMAALHLTAAEFGFAASAVGIGHFLVIPFAGYIITRFGVRVTARIAYLFYGVALTTLAFAPNYGVFLIGMLIGGGTSAMIECTGSTSGSRIEHLYGKPLMPGFIGALSAGSVLGSLIGAGAIALGLSMQAHMLIIAAMVIFLGFIVAPYLLSPKSDPTVGKQVRARPVWSVRLVLISIIVLVSVCEGASFSFATVYMTKEIGATAALAALAVTAHTAGSALAQFSGDWLRARYSAAGITRTFVTVGGAVMAVALLSKSPILALVGFAAFGASVAFVYPAGLSAAADTQPTPTPGIAVAQTVRYIGVFGMATVLGFFADQFGLTQMFFGAIIFSVGLIVAFSGALGKQSGLSARSGGTLPGLHTPEELSVDLDDAGMTGIVPAQGIADGWESQKVSLSESEKR